MDGPMFSFFGRKQNETPTNSDGLDERTIKRLANHPLFQEFQSLDTVQIDSLAIKDPLKKKMAVTYLKLLYHQLEKAANEIVADYVAYCEHPSRIGERLRSCVSETRSQAIVSGVPTVFMDQYEPSTYSVISVIINAIIEIHRNKMYTTTYDEICSVLDICLIYIRIELDLAENLINEMNGELHHALVGSIFDQ